MGDEAMNFNNNYLRQSEINEFKRSNRPNTGFLNIKMTSHYSFKPDF